MSLFEIKHRYTGAVLWSCEAETLREAVELAVKAKTSLDDACLDDACLDGASLRRASLVGASLAGASLAGASLVDAALDGASLDGASLVGASLDGASLRGAYGFDPSQHVEPAGPRASRPTGNRAEILRERAWRYRERHPEVPVVEGLDGKIVACLEAGEGELQMGQWHGDGGACGTTHCRAGFAIHFAGAAGIALEQAIGSERAGRAIYRASTGRAPHFFATNERALADIRRCAAEDAVASAGGAA